MAVFLLRYNEVALKSPPVRRLFERKIIGNLRKRLNKKEIHSRVSWSNGRIFFSVADEKLNEAEEEVRKTFGVVSYSIAHETEKDVESIWGAIKGSFSDEIKNSTSFAVRVVRADKRFEMKSPELAALLGSKILEEYGGKVDLKNPDMVVWVEIRGKACVYSKRYDAVGGMPYGTAGKLCFAAVGRDSILAAWLMMRRGCEIVMCQGCDRDTKEAYEILNRWESVAIRNSGKYDVCLGQVSGAKEASEMEATSLPVYAPLIGFNDGEIARFENILWSA